jgi:hypothetical protein
MNHDWYIFFGQVDSLIEDPQQNLLSLFPLHPPPQKKKKKYINHRSLVGIEHAT